MLTRPDRSLRRETGQTRDFILQAAIEFAAVETHHGDAPLGSLALFDRHEVRHCPRSQSPRSPNLFPATIPHKRGLSSVRKKDFHDLIHPRIERRYLQRFLERRCGPGFWRMAS